MDERISPAAGIICASDELLSEAQALAARLGLPLTDGQSGLCLSLGRDGLSLLEGRVSVRVDFSEYAKRVRPSNLAGELLIKAAKPGGKDGLYAVDATAGFGEDSFLLAAAGFEVIMFERNPVTAALLEDGLTRGKSDPGIAHILARMTLVKGDAIDLLPRLEKRPDLVLLDPMFPQRKKGSAPKKKAQMLEKLEPPCTDGERLLAAAFASGAEKIIIKRPRTGETLGGRKPDYSITGDAVRYDCFFGGKV